MFAAGQAYPGEDTEDGKNAAEEGYGTLRGGSDRPHLSPA
jgi:hypothetical protein